ncbi:MAG: glycosyltransferase family 4 protein [Candidatus Omnitrophica bacterium]|nr:glycosyltransferase family 4 protein [Candidatus Omnitrophota bacterium]
MKILHILDYHPKYHSIYGGAEIATLRLIEKLKTNNIENYILITRIKKKEKIESNIYSMKTMHNLINFNNPNIFRNKIFSIISSFYHLIFPFDIYVFLKSKKVIEKIKPDLIHFHNFKKISFAPLIWAKIFKIPTVLSIYDYWFFCPNETLLDNNGNICEEYSGIKCFYCFKKVSPKYRIFLPFRKYFFNFFLKNIDAFIFLSNASLEIGRKYGLSKRKLIFIPQIFEKSEEDINHNNEIEKNSILYSGWVQYRKGLHILIKAIAEIKKLFPDVKLYVVGEIEKVEKDYVEEILKNIKEMKIERNVIIVGKITPEQIKNYFRKAEILVIPEQWENMSPVILVEGMYNKKAIVASRIGGIKEFIEDGKSGFLCEPKNFKEFAEKIIILLKDKDLAKKMGENAFEKAKKIWNDEKNAKKIIMLYRRLKNG